MILLFRLIAFLIDYGIIVSYAAILFALVVALGLDHQISSPWIGQLTGFLSLTLPVMLYFAILEHGPWHGTFGKWLMGLSVTDQSLQAVSFTRSLTRNLLKFLPWEVAHLGIHWAFYYGRTTGELATWVWIPLVFSQLLAISYAISIVMNSEHRGWYEHWSGTRVIRNDVVS